MATSQVQMTLAVTADTAKARAQLQDLRKQLDDLSKVGLSNSKGFGFDKELATASKAAAQLKAQLEQATNIKTGKLDLTQFTNSLKQGQMSLQQYQQQLANLGPAGDRAFASLSSAITHAEVPLQRTNGLLKDFGVTLANTAKWQISSNIIHGFQSALSEAFGYAQRLNESLTNIRIVTGQSSEQMARFAQQANASAQALSTTTTKYTDAALIFYQQGLGDKDVKERTDAVIKMSHATGDAAQQVSSYMTAIWNNFDDGSESLEHYADVIAKLGATTASSSSEISQGLSKFAAIAKTTGLSYEYATASLATLVANTRESADTIGNSLKTIFARLQGLQLGETLEDGVDLNKYSKALNTIGVNVLDMNGELRDADAILSDMAGKWENLGRAQKVALAQTVAGTRQYATLTSLMDNWDDMEKNLETAGSADGTLQEQADIYAQSWEAARDRVTAAAQEIYAQLINSDFFIGLNNMFTGILNTISDVITSLGGAKGVFFALGTVITSVFQDQIGQSVDNVINRFKMLTSAGKRAIEETRSKANNLLIEGLQDKDTTSSKSMAMAYGQQGTLQQAYLQNASQMNAVQQSIAKSMMDQQQVMIENVRLAAEEKEALEGEASALEKTILGLADKSNNTGFAQLQQELRASAESAGMYETSLQQLATQIPKTVTADNVNVLKEWVNSIQLLQENQNLDIGKAFGDEAQRKFIELQVLFEKMPEDLSKLNAVDLSNLNNALNSIFASVHGNEDADEMICKLAYALEESGVAADKSVDEAEKLYNTWKKAGSGAVDLTVKEQQLKTFTSQLAEDFNKASAQGRTMGQTISSLGSTLMSISTLISNITGLVNVLGDDSKSTGEKIIAVLTTVGTLLMTTSRLMDTATLGSLLNFGPKLVQGISGTIPALSSMAGAMHVAEGATIKLGAALGTTLLAVGLIAGAIVGLVALYNHFKSETPEEKLQKMQEAAEEASSALDETKRAAETVREEFDNYTSIVDKLASCTKGTQEWKDALNDVNNSTLDLLNKYPELAKYIDQTTGQITEAGMQHVQDIYDKRVLGAQMANTFAQQNVINAQQDVGWSKFDDVQKTAMYDPIWTSIQNESENGRSKFMRVGSSELIDFFKEIAPELDGKNVSEQLDALVKGFNEKTYESSDAQMFAGSGALGEVTKQDVLDLFTIMKENGVDLNHLTNQENINNQQQNAQNKLIAEQLLANDTKTQNLDYRDEIIALTGDAINQQYNQIRKDIDDKNTDDIIEVLKANGYQDVSYDKDSKEIKYMGADGAIEGKSVSYMKDLIASQLAAGEFVDSLGWVEDGFKSATQFADDLASSFENLKKQNDSNGSTPMGDSLIKALIGDTDSMSSKELNELARLGVSGFEDLYTKAGIDLEAIAKQNGFDGENAVHDFLEESVIKPVAKSLETNNFANVIESAGNTVSKKVATMANDFDLEGAFDETSLIDKSNLVSIMQSAYENYGEAGLLAVVNTFSALGEKSEELYEVLGTTYGSEEEFIQALNEHGITVEEISPYYNDLSTAMVQIEDTIISLTETVQRSSAAMSASESLRKNNRITAKQYEELAEQGFNHLDGFQQFYDGSYGVIGSVEAMADELENFSADGFIEQIDRLNAKVEAKKDLPDMDYAGMYRGSAIYEGSGQYSAIQDRALDQTEFLRTYASDNPVVRALIAEIDDRGNSQITGDQALLLDQYTQKVIDSLGGVENIAEGMSESVTEDINAIQGHTRALISTADSYQKARDLYNQAGGENITHLSQQEIAQSYLSSHPISEAKTLGDIQSIAQAKFDEKGYGNIPDPTARIALQQQLLNETLDETDQKIKITADDLETLNNLPLDQQKWIAQNAELDTSKMSLQELINLTEEYNDTKIATQAQKDIDSQEKSNIDANFKHNTSYEDKKDEYLNSNMSDAAKAENIISALSNSGKSIEDQAKELSSLYSKAFSEGWDSDAIDILQESIIKLVSSNPDLKIAARLLQLISNSTNELDLTNVDAFGEALKKVNENAEKDLITLADFSKAINNLDVGETINEDVFNQLMLLAPQLKSSFMDMGDGTYRLLTNAEALRLVMLDVYADARTGDAFTYTNEQLAAQAKTLAELDYLDSKRGLSQEEYLKAEASIGLQYENAKEESLQLLQLLQEQKNLQEQIASLEQEKNLTDDQSLYLEGLKTEEKRKQAELDAAKVSSDVAIGASESAAQFGVDAQAVEDLANYYLELAENGEEAYEHLKDNGKAAVDEARQMIRANEACEDLTKNFSKYSKVLDGLKGDTKAYSKTLVNNSKEIKALKKDVAGILDTTEEYIDTNTLAKMSLEDIQKAAEGNIPALRKLQAEQAKSLSSKNNIDEETTSNFNNAMANKGENESVLGGETQTITDADGNQVQMQTLDLDIAPYMQKLAEAVAAAGGTAEDLQALMSGVGIEMDNAQFFNSLEEAEKWAAESNNRTIQSLAIDAKPQEQTAEQSGEVVDAGFDESYSFSTTTLPIRFQEDAKSKPQTDSVRYVAAHKTVVPKQVTEETTASAPVVAVGYENPHTGSSAGGNVKPSGGGGGGGGGGRRSGRGRGRAATRASAKSNPDTSHNIKNNTIQQQSNLTKAYENLSKASEQAFGKSKLNNMDLEIKKQDEIIKKTRELTKETQRLTKQERDRLNGKIETDLTSQYVTVSARKNQNKWVYDQKVVDKSLAKVNINDIIGKDLQFDAYGNIENEDLINAILENRANEAQAAFDSASEGTDKADKETEKNRINAENETIKAELEKYKQDVSDFWEEVADEINQRLEKEAKLLEKRQYQLEINIKVNDNELERLERIMARYEKIDPTIKDIGFSSDSQVTNLKNQQDNTKNKINNNINYIKGILEDKGADEDEIKKFLDEGIYSGSWYTRMTPDDLKALDNTRSEILSLATAHEELGDQLLNLSTSTMQKWNAAIEFQSNKLESGEQTLQHYLNVIDIVGKKQLGLTAKDTFDLRQKQIDVKQVTANASKARYEFAQTSETKAAETLKTLKQQLKKAQESADEEAIQHAQEQLSIQESVYKQAVENTQQALQTWEGDVEEALQLTQEAFQVFSEDIQKSLTDPMALLLSENDRDNRKKEGFNDTTTSLHELAKLQKDINDSLDDAANVKNKEALAKILDKINKAKSDSVELSEYETEELRKEYELEVARQKMEETRNAKSEVRMVRDSEGNFSYVYTADDSAMKNAEKEYEDKLQELYELNRDYINEVKETILNLPGEMADALADLDEKLLNGIITKEQYDEEAKTIEAFYEDLLERYQAQLGKALDNQSNLYDSHYKKLAEKGHEIATDSKFIDSWEDLADQLNIKDIMGDNIKSLEDFTNYLNGKFYDALTDALENASILKEQNKQTLGEEGSLDDKGNYVGKAGKNSLKEAVNEINNAAKDTKNEINDLVTSGKKDIEALGTAINNWAQKATEDFKGVANAVTNTAGNIQKLNQDLTENSGWDIFKSLNSSNSIVNLADYYKNNYISQDEKGNKTIHTTDLLTSLFRTGITEIPIAISILEEVYKKGANGSLQGIGEDNFAIIKAALGFAGYENIKDEDLKKLIKFDSGGYTGSWDTSGKLAMLHEKELVLNQSDTQNILDAVSIIRDISQAINLNAAASSWMGLGLAQAGKVPSANTSDTLQQYVTITLDAPNLTDKNSILEAFDNVINLASQYAYR